HLKDFRERIKINGEMIPRDFVTAFVEKTKTFSEEIEPSFFELTFVMSLEYFVHNNVDIAIIETGLGGRLDSTNVIIPMLSVITNIGFDHMDILGDSLSKIAYEKAGIIKPAIPVVIGEAIPETKIIFQEKAQETKSAIFFAEEKFTVNSVKQEGETLQVEVFDIDKKQSNNYELDLYGLYQAKNLLTVLTAIDLLKNNFSLEEKKVHEALVKVKKLTGLHGRWEVIHRKPLVVLDVAHNVDGIRQLINQINHSRYKKLHIIFGIVKDKEIKKVLELLPAEAEYYFTRAQIPRALPENELLERAAEFHLKGSVYSEVNIALKAAMDMASEEDMVIVCGSIFVVGEVDLFNVEN
ncbi:MAG: Mur ligase family protein, partial [Ginsengibacter sp.]